MTTAAIPADIVIHHILPRLPCDDFNWLYARSDASWRRGFMMPSCAFRKDVHYDVVSHVLRHEAHADAKAFVRAVGYRCVHDAKNIAVWIGALGSNDVRTVALMMRDCPACAYHALIHLDKSYMMYDLIMSTGVYPSFEHVLTMVIATDVIGVSGMCHALLSDPRFFQTHRAEVESLLWVCQRHHRDDHEPLDYQTAVVMEQLYTIALQMQYIEESCGSDAQRRYQMRMYSRALQIDPLDDLIRGVFGFIF
jgi:hypothetical protein